MKKIKSLESFQSKETFVFLYSRACYLQKLILTSESITKLTAEVRNTLRDNGICSSTLYRVYAEDIYVLYRSMFQNAQFEIPLDDICNKNGLFSFITGAFKKILSHLRNRINLKNTYRLEYMITSKAYGIRDKNKILHKEIIDHVNAILAHQDNVENGGNRGIYPPITGEDGTTTYVGWDFIPRHPGVLLPFIKLMKKSIKTAYYNKFNEELNYIDDDSNATTTGE